MNIFPLGNRIIVRSESIEEVTKSGIIMNDEKRERMGRGVVVYVGEGKTLDNGTIVPCKSKIGQTIYYGKHLGIPLPVGILSDKANEFYVFKEEEALFILQEDEMVEDLEQEFLKDEYKT